MLHGVRLNNSVWLVQASCALVVFYSGSTMAQPGSAPASAAPAAVVPVSPPVDQPMGMTDFQRTEAVRESERVPRPAARSVAVQPALVGGQATGSATAAPATQRPDQPMGMTDFQREEIVRQTERIPRPAADDKVTTFEPAIKIEALKSRAFPPITWGCPGDEWKLQIAGDTRLRLERRDNWDMNESVGDNDKLAFLRTRLNFELTKGKEFRGFMTILDGRQFDHRAFTDPRQEDHVDLQQLFIELHPECSPWWVRAGRWIPPTFGAGRHIDYGGWPNLINTWQGVLADYEEGDLDLHLYVAQQLMYENAFNHTIRSGRLRTKQHEWLYGAYATLHNFRPHKLDVYLLGQSDLDDERTFPSSTVNEEGEIGSLDRYTAGSYLRGPICEVKDYMKVTYGLEGAFQFGQKAGDTIDAGMLHGDLNWEWVHPMKPTISLVTNLATGDKDPDDGEDQRFVQYPSASNHGPYGIIDFTRLSNLREIALVAKAEPKKDLKVAVELHKFWLDSKTDTWVGPGGRDKTGNSGRDIGYEIDFIVNKKVNDCLTVEAGAAKYFGGNFSDSVGRDDNAGFVYFQTVFAF